MREVGMDFVIEPTMVERVSKFDFIHLDPGENDRILIYLRQ